MIEKIRENKNLLLLISSLIGVLIGLLIGMAVLLVINAEGAWDSMIAMLQNFLYFPDPKIAAEYFGYTLIRTTPLLLCAISVIYSKKAGLFNIGASGQYTVGACTALYLSLSCRLPWWICLPAAMLAAGLCGALLGFLKAYRNVNEVISGILVNWIAVYLVNMILEPFTDSSGNTLALHLNAPQSILPGLGLSHIFGGNQFVGFGLILTPLLVILIHFILTKTTIGYETRATGFNLKAATMAGMNARGGLVRTMFISGCLAGLGAGCIFLCGLEHWQNTVATVPGIGFDAIAAAYLGGLSPFGAILSSYFIQHIAGGSSNMNRMLYPTEISQMITAIIIYCSAFSAILTNAILNLLGEKRKEKKA